MKINKAKNEAFDTVMNIAYDKYEDPAHRIKFYRKVAWELMVLAVQMEAERELFS